MISAQYSLVVPGVHRLYAMQNLKSKFQLNVVPSFFEQILFMLSVHQVIGIYKENLVLCNPVIHCKMQRIKALHSDLLENIAI